MIFSFKYYICNNSKLVVFPEKWLLFSLQLLFQLIIDYLTDFSFTPAVFEMITEQLKKTYFNILIKPETLAKWVLGEGKGGCAAVVKVEQRAQKSLLCAGGGLFWGGSWPWELRQLCSQCIKLKAQTRPAGSCSSEAASSRGWGRAGWAHSSASPESEVGSLALSSSWWLVVLFSFCLSQGCPSSDFRAQQVVHDRQVPDADEGPFHWGALILC